MRTSSTAILLFGLCASGLACGTRDPALTRSLSLMDPVALDASLVLVDKTAPSAYLVDLHAGRLDAAAQQLALPTAPTIAVRRNQTNEALVVCLGRRATRDSPEEKAELVALTADGHERRYVLGDPFDSMVQSDDGQYAFLFKSGTAERLLENPNEVVIVDLNAPPGPSSVHPRKLRSFDDSPLNAVFSPTMRILDEDRRLAVVLSRNNVTLIDLNHLDRIETTVQLSTASDSSVQPSQVLFGLGDARVFVRGASQDVFAFNLIARPADDTSADSGTPHNDFRPFIDQLGVGGLPSDIALYQSGPDATPELLAVEGAVAQVAVVDPSTSEVTSLKLAAAADQLLLFDATSPRSNEVQSRALLYSLGATSLAFLDLIDLDTRGTQNLETLTLAHPIAKLIPLLDEHLALAIHAEGGASLIDLAERTVSPIRSDVPLQDALFDSQRRRLWVGPSGDDRVGYLDLDDGTTGEVLLDAPIAALVPLFAHDQVVVLHDNSIGYATVLSASAPKRATAQSIRGFLIADLLERGR